jgi:hypothetical protein
MARNEFAARAVVLGVNYFQVGWRGKELDSSTALEGGEACQGPLVRNMALLYLAIAWY